jgi:hypothetical protein
MISVQQLAREQAFYARRKFSVPAPTSARARPGRSGNWHCAALSHCRPGGPSSENSVSRAQARSDLPKLDGSGAILVALENLSVEKHAVFLLISLFSLSPLLILVFDKKRPKYMF